MNYLKSIKFNIGNNGKIVPVFNEQVLHDQNEIQQYDNLNTMVKESKYAEMMHNNHDGLTYQQQMDLIAYWFNDKLKKYGSINGYCIFKDNTDCYYGAIFR